MIVASSAYSGVCFFGGCSHVAITWTGEGRASWGALVWQLIRTVWGLFGRKSNQFHGENVTDLPSEPCLKSNPPADWHIFFLYTTRDVIRLSSFAHIHTQLDSSYFHCGQWEWLLLRRQSRLYSRLFVKEIKASIKSVKLVCQCDLIHGGGASGVTARDIQ